MRKIALLALLAGTAGACQASLTPDLQIPSPTISVPGPTVEVQPVATTATVTTTAAPMGPAGAPPVSQGDAEYFLADDYLVCDGWGSCYIGHNMGNGQFLMAYNGQTVSTNKWITSRPLAPTDQLSLGETVLYLGGGLPQSRNDAVNAQWSVGNIGDLSQLAQSQVTIQGSQYPVANLRIIVQMGHPYAP